jgi:hypothetical protein
MAKPIRPVVGPYKGLTHVRQTFKMQRLLIAVLAAAVCLLAAGPSIAQAAKPCYDRVLDDWTADGQIDGTFSKHCLRQAIKHTPEDLRDYSSIIDDINAALLGGVGTRNGPNGGPGNGAGNGAGNGTNQRPPSPAEAKRRAEKAVPHAGTPESIPDSSRSVPLPLLILAAIALAAVLAAAAPPLIQRARTRFVRPRPAPQADR